jgi:hypothetical protein
LVVRDWSCSLKKWLLCLYLLHFLISLENFWPPYTIYRWSFLFF